MKDEIITKIINGMLGVLETRQIQQLKTQLYIVLSDVKIEKKKNEIIPYEDINLAIVQKFVDAKIAAGKSQRTANIYGGQIRFALCHMGKNYDVIDEDDIRIFLYKYQIHRNNKNSTVKNMRAYLSSFFGWLRKNRYIKENPMDLVEPIKEDYTIKAPYKDEEIVQLKDACTNIRDRALIDFLDASLIRIGELRELDRKDVVFTERECIVYGKGRKERVAYFNGEAKIHLEQYIKTRKDNDPALFVGLRKNHGRLTISGLQDILKRTGKRAGIMGVHAHRFRRTGATRCLSAGMPVEELQILMGHTDIKTTLIYAKVDRKKVKFKYNAICSW